MTRGWSTSIEIASKVRRRWDDGSLLRVHASAQPFDPIDIPLRGPKASEIGDDLVAVRNWIAELEDGSAGGRRYDLVSTPVGGRHFGRNLLPARAMVSSIGQATALLGVGRSIQRFEDILSLANDASAVRGWVLAHPHRALELHDAMPDLIAAFTWLDAHRDSGRYLREISAPGVHTKFAENNRPVLAAMLGVSSTSAGFLAGLGLRAKPEMVRVRLSPTLGLPSPLTEISLRSDELSRLPITPHSALVIENEITYLSVDIPANGIVIWGKGFEVDRVGRLPWLTHVPVTYWGDIDTHGFAILDRLRAWLPHTRSALMDQETLLAHRERWVREDRPAVSNLTRLSLPELGLYSDLVSDRLGHKVRLEQELIDWTWATTALARPID